MILYGINTLRFKVYWCRFFALVSDKRFERVIEFRSSSALVYQYARIAFLRSRVAIFRYFFFSVPDSRRCGLQQIFWHTWHTFVSQSPYPFLCHVRNILFPYSFPFAWRVLVSNTFKHSSPVIIFIVYTGEDVTDMPRCVS